MEKVAEEYGVAITFLLKFHCELNSIEGLWAHQKHYIRQRTDQTFPTMVKLIQNSRVNFIEHNIAAKLVRRFWRTLEAYDRGDSYEEILKMYFNSLCTGAIQRHCQIRNSISGDGEQKFH